MNDTVALNSKVARLIEEYDMTECVDELEHRWLGKGGDRESLRNLADWFNQRLIGISMERAGVEVIDGEVENLYQLLTGDDVSIKARTQGETRLSRDGIDVESLRDDFVSHQAMHTYLTKFRGVTHPKGEETTSDTVENRRDSIQKLRNRLVVVSEQNLESLRRVGGLDIGSVDVTVGVTVHCKDCEKSFDITELFDEGGCDCP